MEGWEGQCSTVEPSQSHPTSRRALSHGTSWKPHTFPSCLCLCLTPWSSELSGAWQILGGSPDPWLLQKPSILIADPFHDPSPPWCLMPQHLSELFSSLLFFASCPFLPSSFPSDKALLWVGGGRGMPPAPAGEPGSHCGCTPEWRRSLELLNSLFFLSSKAAVC